MIWYLSVLLCIIIVGWYYKLTTLKTNLKNALTRITQLEQELALLKIQAQTLLKKELELTQEKNELIESLKKLQQEYQKIEVKLKAAYEECYRARQRAKRMHKLKQHKKD